ncbi:hypothetical protein B0H10DRAFT_1958809 [Mycena sp. CBHHK59/15]|nr:hypothetical protein B0H10DRAFT_1958809 [Mycena sp. CBHHK59/15]
MASSLALIPYDPDANKALAGIDENSRPYDGRWALVVHALIHLYPGRTLGPHAMAQKIKSYFGNGGDRLQRLEALPTTTVPSKLEKRCFKLVRYTLAESASMQHQAFKEIVDLVTLFPGLRLVFLRTRFLGSEISTDTISTLWERPTGSPTKNGHFGKPWLLLL